MEKNIILFDKILDAERSKNNYFINLSHELRTPLNVINSIEQLIRSFCRSEKELFLLLSASNILSNKILFFSISSFSCFVLLFTNLSNCFILLKLLYIIMIAISIYKAIAPLLFQRGAIALYILIAIIMIYRSEERRVGKECTG